MVGLRRLPMRIWIERWATILLVILVAIAVWFAYQRYSRPVEVKSAVGPATSDEYAFLSEIARRRESMGGHSLHFTIVARDGPIEAAQALERGEADLAVIRGDLPVPGKARAVLVLY